MLHRREFFKNSCHGRYLPVEVLLVDDYGRGMQLDVPIRIKHHMNPVFDKLELGAVELEVLYCVHKLEGIRNGK
jgi:hypothetical protein